MSMKKPLILSIDDDPECQRLIKTFLIAENYNVITTDNPTNVNSIIDTQKPDLILLDILMPDMNGYEFCEEFRKREESDYHPPIIFLSALDQVEDKARAFQVGASDYIEKPIKKHTLLDKVWINLTRSFEWMEVSNGTIPLGQVLTADYFDKFRGFLKNQLNFTEEEKEQIDSCDSMKPYDMAEILKISDRHMAQYIAAFLHLKYLQVIVPETINTDILGAHFCKANLVIPIKGKYVFGSDFVVANPFNWELIDTLDQIAKGQNYRIFITEPQNILTFFKEHKKLGTREPEILFNIDPAHGEDQDNVVFGALDEDIDIESSKYPNPIKYISNKIVYKAVMERASDIHIEAKQTSVVIRFRVDGELQDILTLKRATGNMVLNHFKSVGGLDIAEKLLPQDGSVDTKIGDRAFRLRLATTSTPDGESMIIRLLEPHAKVLELKDLGMTPDQRNDLVELARTPSGLIMVVGPTGSGKTTTIYSLIGTIDTHARSLCTVEDPVEYRIPHANQQQINVKRGVTFETLLRSIVRQDPDILFLGETRDNYTAKMAIDFSSTGHMTITTMHTKNSVAALFRLERLGVQRAAMADAVIGIIAQRLIKKPCPYCREIVNITEKEIEMLSPFTDDIPSETVVTNGCLKCNNTGYHGREGVYEILTVTPEIAKMIREGVSVLDIRDFLRRKGAYLIVDHVLDKVRDKIFTVKDAYQYVLREEKEQVIDTRNKILDRASAALDDGSDDFDFSGGIPSPVAKPESIYELEEQDINQSIHPSSNSSIVETQQSEQSIPKNRTRPQYKQVPITTDKVDTNIQNNDPNRKKSILLIDDDINIRNLLQHYIKRQGYDVSVADDGVSALLTIGEKKFDLIISDVNMPNLDGFKLLKILKQQKIDVPLIFLTSRHEEEFEVQGLDLGAADYIVKPIKFPVLRLRIKRILGDI